MKNLILGTALGYNWKDIKIFVKSLRNYFDGDVFLLMNSISSINLINKLKFYRINTITCSLFKNDFKFRYHYFYNFLKKNNKNYNLIMFTDVRDVFFQSDPFLKKYKNPINFYEEDEIIKNCKINSLWVQLALGEKKFNLYKNNYIVCGGTIIGKARHMLSYFNLIRKKINKMRMKFSFRYFFLRRSIRSGIDQPACLDIVYRKMLTGQKIFSNRSGNIATVGHMKNLIFSKKNKLINNKNKIYDVVHQYDRQIKLFKKTIKSCINN
jgi:hypothetical protein